MRTNRLEEAVHDDLAGKASLVTLRAVTPSRELRTTSPGFLCRMVKWLCSWEQTPQLSSRPSPAFSGRNRHLGNLRLSPPKPGNMH